MAAGGRLVFTNGCFDILHAGHVRYLRVARSLGEALAVGINSDRSVRRLKGAGRPIVHQEDRAEVVAALRAVDYVVIFDDDTASEVIREVRPALYVKGGDYCSDPDSVEFPPEARIVQSYGGQIRMIDFVPGHSTTDLIAKMALSPKRVRQSPTL
ncbi:MAG: hypothetical protein NVSMB52_19500 [Chloroflexota bacterium]